MIQYNFVSFAIETIGSLGSKAKGLLKALGRRLSDVTGEPKSRTYLLQRISIALQRGNASSILGTIPSSSSLEEFYYF